MNNDRNDKLKQNTPGQGRPNQERQDQQRRPGQPLDKNKQDQGDKGGQL